MQDEGAAHREPLEARLALMAEELESARAQAAAYALALDVLGCVDSAKGPDAVSEIVVRLFTALFAPGEIRLTVAEPVPHRFGALPDGAERAQQTFVPSADGEGFRVRLVHEGRLVGTLDVDRLAMPAYRDRYENIALTIGPVVAMLLVHARALHGLIAICAYCKRIRDGQGAWHVLEEYLTEHSEALFSHGVCPACLAAASAPDDAPTLEAPSGWGQKA
jgi:hypothetical protein